MKRSPNIPSYVYEVVGVYKLFYSAWAAYVRAAQIARQRGHLVRVVELGNRASGYVWRRMDVTPSGRIEIKEP